MEQKKIDRINELTRLAKQRELTAEEQAERAVLRREYIDLVTGGLKTHLDNTYLMDEKGNKTKLKKKNDK